MAGFMPDYLESIKTKLIGYGFVAILPFRRAIQMIILWMSTIRPLYAFYTPYRFRNFVDRKIKCHFIGVCRFHMTRNFPHKLMCSISVLDVNYFGRFASIILAGVLPHQTSHFLELTEFLAFVGQSLIFASHYT
jgi:hypothetical protein